jgi:hypothetical protein
MCDQMTTEYSKQVAREHLAAQQEFTRTTRKYFFELCELIGEYRGKVASVEVEHAEVAAPLES